MYNYINLGALPQAFGNLVSLIELDVSFNSITGTITILKTNAKIKISFG